MRLKINPAQLVTHQAQLLEFSYTVILILNTELLLLSWP